jgi:threonine dehydrogenase-like Zn-dependent dehydrogenase
MVLGHEAAGVVVEVGEQVKNLKPGGRVCMEPGIPDPNSRAARLGIYNLDPAVHFSEAWSYRCPSPEQSDKSTVYSGKWKRWNLQSQGFH